MNNRTAIVFGGTGLVGKYLIEELIRNMRYTAIKVFTRKRLGIEHIKVVEHLVDVEDIESYSDDIRGDDLYICIGTTMKQARNVKRYEQIDRDLPVNIGLVARQKGIKRAAVVSSLGANPESRNYYSRIKGEMEQGLLQINFERTVIARPSMLLGERAGFRMLEAIGKGIMKIFSFILVGKLKVFKAIHGRDVARAMIEGLGESAGKKTYLSDELKELSDRAKGV